MKFIVLFVMTLLILLVDVLAIDRRSHGACHECIETELTNQNHYGNPANGCIGDELPIRIAKVKGSVCSPECTFKNCPTDIPKNSNARPQCALQNGYTKKKYCALICNKNTNCGEKTSCKMVTESVGICTY